MTAYDRGERKGQDLKEDLLQYGANIFSMP